MYLITAKKVFKALFYFIPLTIILIRKRIFNYKPTIVLKRKKLFNCKLIHVINLLLGCTFIIYVMYI